MSEHESSRLWSYRRTALVAALVSSGIFSIVGPLLMKPWFQYSGGVVYDRSKLTSLQILAGDAWWVVYWPCLLTGLVDGVGLVISCAMSGAFWGALLIPLFCWMRRCTRLVSRDKR